MITQTYIGYAKPFTDPALIADFLELRLQRRPKFVGTLLKLEGMSPSPTREELLEYAAKRAFVAIHPSETVLNKTDK